MLTDGLARSIMGCGQTLAAWNDKQFGDLPKQIKKCKEELSKLQSAYQSLEMTQACRSLENRLAALLRKEEVFWLQRSRVSWMREGDKNTNFFHKVASGRKKRNHIAKIEDEFGNVFPEEEDIQRVFVDYYTKLFTAKSNLEMEEAVEAVSYKMSTEMQNELSQPFTEEEVTTTLNQMHPCKASGPDGMSALFFQKFWSVVGKSVIHSTLNVLNNGASPATLNHTFIALIPKFKHPRTPTEFRPISLCNVSFKIITKTIVNRLKRFLPLIIDPSQSAFVPGRLITDNALLAYEVFHYMKHNKAISRGSYAFKLDMSKAYDRVEWAFLEGVMRKIGIGDRLVETIMGCVRFVSFRSL